jgi:hypothetical protein
LSAVAQATLMGRHGAVRLWWLTNRTSAACPRSQRRHQTGRVCVGVSWWHS